MTYPVPSFSTIAGAQAVAGVDLNRLVDAANDLNTRMINTNGRVRLRRVANQNIANNLSTAMNWDTEDLDNGGFIVVTANTLTVPTGLDGTYGMTFRAAGAPASGRCFGEIAVTSTVTGAPPDYRTPMTLVENRIVVGITIPLLAGDTIQCNVYQASGVGVNFTAWLNCVRIGA